MSKSHHKNKKNFSPLAQDTFDAFEPFINVFDCGGSWTGGVYHLITKEEWQLFRRHKQGERDLKYEDGDKFNVYRDVIRNIYGPLHVEKHMQEGEISYYTSGKRGLALLYLDIDAHHRWQTDEYKAKALLQKLFPGGYFRASRRGQNGYLKVRYNSIPQLNTLADQLEASLKGLFLHLGILCDIEVKGTITHKDKSGTLAKLPFATKYPESKRDESDSWDAGQLELFKSCPILNVQGVRNIVEQLSAKVDEEKVQRGQKTKERLALEEEGKEKKISRKSTPRKSAPTDIVSKPDDSVADATNIVLPTSDKAKQVAPANPPINPAESDDAFVRNHKDIPPFMREFYRKQHRLPTTAETLKWLKSQGLFSGSWEENQYRRTKRVGQILEYKSQTFDPKMLSGGEHSLVDLRRGRFTRWVREKFGSYLTGSVVELQRFDPVAMTAPTTEVTVPAPFVERFVTVADVCLNQDPLNNKAVPTNRFKALWKLAGEEVPWNQRYYQVVRDRLDRMGVITIFDRHHAPGKAWRWETGSLFPRFVSTEELKKLRRSRQLVVITVDWSGYRKNIEKNKIHNTLYHIAERFSAPKDSQQAVRPPP